MDARIIKATSKKTGREYKCIEIKVGVYSARIYPTPAEIAYLEEYLKDKAYEDFDKGTSSED